MEHRGGADRERGGVLEGIEPGLYGGGLDKFEQVEEGEVERTRDAGESEGTIKNCREKGTLLGRGRGYGR